MPVECTCAHRFALTFFFIYICIFQGVLLIIRICPHCPFNKKLVHAAVLVKRPFSVTALHYYCIFYKTFIGYCLNVRFIKSNCYWIIVMSSLYSTQQWKFKITAINRQPSMHRPLQLKFCEFDVQIDGRGARTQILFLTRSVE